MLGALHLRPDQAPGRPARPAPAIRSAAPFPGSACSRGQAPSRATRRTSRLPEEAKYLASLQLAKAIAIRLDTRATRERARRGSPKARTAPVTARWSWPAIAAVVLPALALLIAVLA